MRSPYSALVYWDQICGQENIEKCRKLITTWYLLKHFKMLDKFALSNDTVKPSSFYARTLLREIPLSPSLSFLSILISLCVPTSHY